MSQKPQKAPGQDKKQRKRKKKTKQTLTRAVTHIRLIEANPGKLEALDQLIAVYLPLCQQYVSLLCTQEADPDKFADPVFETVLSDRLHRAVIQQAAGIARSWRTNRQAAYDAYLERLADWKQAQEQKPDPERKEPQWREWKVPELRVPCIQANANIVVVEKSEDSSFDYWLRISTLDKGHPMHVMRTFLFKQSHQPLAWASMWESQILSRPRRENSTAVFLAHSPGITSATGQRLALHVRQEINRAVNLMIADHPNARIIYEELSVASMRFKARSMNAYQYASNLAHIPDQIAWATARRGIAAHTVKAAYSSQECHRCHYPDRANRPNQQTFHCTVCGHRDHADHNAALNLAQRFGDQDLAACKNKGEVKAVLLSRHDEWKQKHGLVVVQPAVQLGLRDHAGLQRT